MYLPTLRLLPRLFRPTPFGLTASATAATTLPLGLRLSSSHRRNPSPRYDTPNSDEPIPLYPPGSSSDGQATDQPSAMSKHERLDIQSEYAHQGLEEHAKDVEAMKDPKERMMRSRDERIGTYFGREAAVGMEDERGEARRETKGADEGMRGRHRAEDGEGNQGYIKGWIGRNGKRKN